MELVCLAAIHGMDLWSPEKSQIREATAVQDDAAKDENGVTAQKPATDQAGAAGFEAVTMRGEEAVNDRRMVESQVGVAEQVVAAQSMTVGAEKTPRT